MPTNTAPDRLPSAPTGPHLVTAAEACRRLACGRTKLWDLRRTGQLPTVTLGGAVRFRLSDLDALVNGSTVRATDDLATLANA